MSAPNVHPHGELHNPDTAYEHSDISIPAIVTFVVLLATTTIVVQVAMYGVFILFNRMEAAADPAVSPLATPADEPPPDPRLQTTPWSDLKVLRAQESSYLHGYGWIDEKAGVARIPIEKAKSLLLQKGLPVRPDVGDPTEGTSIAATGESSGGRNLPGAAPEAPRKPGGGQ
jgi:hypothetical protein